MKPFPKKQFYDMQTDSYGIKNRVDSNDREHRETLVQLRATLDTWIFETGDLGRWPEPPEVVASFVNQMHDWSDMLK